jgi:hypothetical protein
MSEKSARQPSGIPVGGQFANQNRAESAANLSAFVEERMFTCFGRWVDDELVIDYTAEGEQEDHRPDEVAGYQSFCASASGVSAEAAELKVLQEYDPDQLATVGSQ